VGAAGRPFEVLVLVASYSLAVAPASAVPPQPSPPSREPAQSLLVSLSAEAEGFADRKVRARVSVEIGELLWDLDRDRARVLFETAWRLAQEGDAAKPDRAPLATLGAEVLKRIGRVDPALRDRFLEDLTPSAAPATGGEDGATPADASTTATGTSDHAGRLLLARQLLTDVDPRRALRVAGPSLRDVTMEALVFLAALRAKDAAEADAAYGRLLQRAAADPSSDPATVSLLASYLFTPFMFTNMTRTGALAVYQWDAPHPPPVTPSALNTAFFDTAAEILLRPPPPAGDGVSLADANGYFVIGRLLPLFERLAPQYAPALLARRLEQAEAVPDKLRADADRGRRRGLAPEEGDTAGGDDGLEDRLAHAATPADRDEAFARAAERAAARGDSSAESDAQNIEDEHARERALELVEASLVDQALRRNETEVAIRLARSSRLSPARRAAAFTRVAAALRAHDPQRARTLLREALAEAQAVEDGSSRFESVVAIMEQAAALERGASWDLIADAAAALESPVTTSDGPLDTESALSRVFRTLAVEDPDRALDLARRFKPEGPRSAAILAVARVLWSRRPAPHGAGHTH
jgi:hypothetical protein